MRAELKEISGTGWMCTKCNVPLEQMPVDIAYLQSNFQVELPRCPTCGFTYIPEELALGKMLEVEKILEDK